MEVEIKSFLRSHIDAVVTNHSLDLRRRLTGFYGNLDTNLRRESWNLLRMLNSQYQIPWMCMKDYNEILSTTEKCEGPERSQNQMEGFRNVSNECGFQDMGYVGPKFTGAIGDLMGREFVLDWTGCWLQLIGWSSIVLQRYSTQWT